MRLRGFVFSALFAALFAVLSLVNIPVGVVPITLENLVVMLTGGLLGAWYGGFTYLLVIGLDVIGLPLIDGRAGLGVLLGPTAGYIWAYPLCAWLMGMATRRIRSGARGEFLLLCLAAFVLGDLPVYIPGVLWLRHVVGNESLGRALLQGCAPFILGDAVKAVIAGGILQRVRKYYPQTRIIYGQQFVSAEDALANAKPPKRM